MAAKDSNDQDTETTGQPATSSTGGESTSMVSAAAVPQPAGEIANAVEEAIGTVSRVANAVPAAAAAAAAVSTDLTTELNNIDFKKMIGGPLQAAVDAQVASSLATVDFIQKVGFSQPLGSDGQPDLTKPRELVMVEFSHKRTDVDDKGTPVVKESFIKVPLLAMLPIPSLRIEQVIIDFNVKLNSVQTASASDKLGINAEVKGGWGPVSFKVSASYQRKTATGVEVKKEYALNVNVKAVQDEMPAGLEKILGLLAA
jgi:hypothetical protein